MADNPKVTKVTYDGPEDPNDVSTVLEIPQEAGRDGEQPPNVVLPQGVEVETTAAVAKAAQAVKGHKVTVSNSGSGSGS